MLGLHRNRSKTKDLVLNWKSYATSMNTVTIWEALISLISTGKHMCWYITRCMRSHGGTVYINLCNVRCLRLKVEEVCAAVVIQCQATLVLKDFIPNSLQYATQRKSIRSWIPQCYWMLDHACINAFKIGVYSPGKHWTSKQHYDFRELLWQELYKFAPDAVSKRQADMLPNVRLDGSILHSYIKVSEAKGSCAWCTHEALLTRARSRTPSPTKRCFSDQIDPNGPSGRAKRMLSGCSGCGVFLCGFKKHDCWYYWHGQQPPPGRRA